MKNKKQYSDVRINAKKTVTEWLLLYANEKNPSYTENNGLCFRNDIIGEKFNTINSGIQNKIRFNTVDKMIDRVNLLFHINFNKTKDKISKELFEIFILIYSDTGRSVPDVDGIKRIDGLNKLAKGKLEILSQSTIDAIIYYSKKNDEILNLIRKYSETYNQMENFGYSLSVEQYLDIGNSGYVFSAEQDVREILDSTKMSGQVQRLEMLETNDPIESRIIDKLNNLCSNYRLIREVQRKIISICNEKMFELTGQTWDCCTPDKVLKEYHNKTSHKDNAVNFIQQVHEKYFEVNPIISDVNKLLTNIEAKLEKQAKATDAFLNKLDKFNRELFTDIATKRLIEDAINKTPRNNNTSDPNVFYKQIESGLLTNDEINEIGARTNNLKSERLTWQQISNIVKIISDNTDFTREQIRDLIGMVLNSMIFTRKDAIRVAKDFKESGQLSAEAFAKIVEITKITNKF